MAAPVRIEAEAFGDPRFDVLGELLGTTRFDALGRMAYLWSWATDRGRMDVPVHIARVYFGTDDRVAYVVDAELGEWVGCVDIQQNGDSVQQNPTKSSKHPAGCQHIQLRGGAGRLEWLTDRRATKANGGKRRAETAIRGPNGAFLPKTPACAGDAGPADSQQPTSGQPAESSALSMAMSISEKSSAPPSAGGRRGRPKPGEPTEAEFGTARVVLEKLGAQNGVAYSGGAEHVRLIVARLRDGASESDLCAVIAYCWTELDWKNKPEMAKYLRPETLFGPKTISKYLDPARSWAAKRRRPAAASPPAETDSPPPIPAWTLDLEAR